MNEFFESKFVDDLKDGKLPPVEITVEDQTLIKIFAGSLITVVAMLVAAALIKKFL